MMRLADVNAERYTPGRSLLLFITDRCPVGCGHCSVDSRRDSPMISDFTLFTDIVDEICADPELTTVGISGGEPFVERRGLTLATERLAAAGKSIVLYTSGVWARAGEQPSWIHDVLDRCSCVFLSTDAYHAESVDDARYIAAARAVAAHGVPIVVQVIRMPTQLAAAENLLRSAFGTDFADHAEIVPTPPLAHGRGAGLFEPRPVRRAGDLGRCTALSAPVVRYDGTLTPCCNEGVIMGAGPDRLRIRSTGQHVRQDLARFRNDPLLGALAAVGPAGVAKHPALTELEADRHHGTCDFCWKANARTTTDVGAPSDPLLTALALLPIRQGSQPR